MNPLRRGDLARVYGVLLLLSAADGLVSTLVSPFLLSLGYPLADLGVLVALYAVASLVSRAPAGRLAEGARARRWFVLACGAFALALALYPVAVPAWAFWSVRVLHGVAFGTATTLNFATFLAVSTGTNRARATALYTASMSAGYSLGNFASGLLADRFGYGVAFLLSALCPAGALALGPAVAPARPPVGPLPLPGSWRALRRPDVLAIPALAFGVNFHVFALGTLFPLYVLSIGQPLAIAGTTRGLQSLSNALVRPFGSPVVRALGPVGLGCAGLALTAAAVAALPLTTLPLLFGGLAVVAGVGRAGGVLANAMSTVDLSERGVLKRGTASALMTAGGDLGAIAAPLVGGATAARIGVGPALEVLPLAAAAVGILALLAGHRPGRAA